MVIKFALISCTGKGYSVNVPKKETLRIIQESTEEK